MSVFGQLASLMLEPKKDAGFEDTFASRFGAAPLDAAEAAALRQRQFTNRRQGSGAARAETVMGGLADLSKSLGEPVTRITDYSRSRIGTEAPVTEEDIFRQDLASRNIGKGVAQAGAYGLPLKNPLAAVPSQAELRGGQLLAETPKAPPVVVQGIRAYHGSPHDFDKFDLSRIGTGEGAQAYGHGLYFAENEGVARSYYDQFMKPRNVVEARNRAIFERNNRDWPAAIDEIMSRYHDTPKHKAAYRAQLLREGPPTQSHMYEVNLNARPEQFLDWDRPLKEQSIYETVRKVSPNELPNMPDVATGAQVYDALKNRAMSRLDPSERQMPRAYQPHAATALREAGIPGIRYLDQGSRPPPQYMLDRARQTLAGAEAHGDPAWIAKNKAEVARLEELMTKPGTSNYVVFDPGIIDILRKYGIAGAGATGFGTLAAQDNYRQ